MLKLGIFMVNDRSFRSARENKVAGLANRGVIGVLGAEEISSTPVIEVAVSIGASRHKHATRFTRLQPATRHDQVRVLLEVQAAQIHDIPVIRAMVQRLLHFIGVLLPQAVDNIERDQFEQTPAIASRDEPPASLLQRQCQMPEFSRQRVIFNSGGFKRL